MKNRLSCVGILTEYIAELIGSEFSCTNIYQSSGLIKHIQNRHPLIVKYFEKIPEILKAPDFFGKNRKTPNKIEYVKRYDQNILLGIVLDKEKDYLYVATLYNISEYKLNNRIRCGRLKQFKKIDFFRKQSYNEHVSSICYSW